MSRSLLAKLRIQMESDLARKSERDGRALRRLGRSGEREFNRLGRAAIRADRALNNAMRRTGQVVGAGIGFAAAASLRRLAQLETRLERVGITAGKASDEMEAIRDQINAIANDPDIRIDPAEIFGALDAFTRRTGEFDFGIRIAEQMAIAIQATGNAGKEIGNLAAVLKQQFGIDTPLGMLELFDALAKQGKAGSIELSDLARVGPKVFAASGRTGATGLSGAIDANALMQIFSRGVGSAEEAATVFENVINNLGDPTRLQTLRDLGIDTSQGTIPLLQEIIRSAGGNDEHLRRIFDAEAFRGVGLLSREFRDTSGFESLESLRSIRGDGSMLRADSARIAGVTTGSFRGVVNTLNDIIEDTMMPGMKRLADALNALSDQGVKFTIEDAAALAGGAALTIGGAKLALGGARLLGSRRAGGATRGAAGALGAAAGITPVYVTNFPGGMGRRMGFDEAAANFDRGRSGAGQGPRGSNLPTGRSRAATALRGIAGLSIAGLPLLAEELGTAASIPLHEGWRARRDRNQRRRAGLDGRTRGGMADLTLAEFTGSAAASGGRNAGRGAREIERVVDGLADVAESTKASGVRVERSIERMGLTVARAVRGGGTPARDGRGRIMEGPR